MCATQHFISIRAYTSAANRAVPACLSICLSVSVSLYTASLAVFYCHSQLLCQGLWWWCGAGTLGGWASQWRVNRKMNYFLSFQLNAQNTLNTCICLPPHTSYMLRCLFNHLHRDHCVTCPKTMCFLQCCYKIYNIYCFFFSIYNPITMFKTIRISSFCILKILKMSVKTLNCSTLTF